MSVFLGIAGDRCENNVTVEFKVANGAAKLGNEIVVPVTSRQRNASALMITSTSFAPVTYTLAYRAYSTPERRRGTRIGSCGVP